jgi:hypothetical protein
VAVQAVVVDEVKAIVHLLVGVVVSWQTPATPTHGSGKVVVLLPDASVAEATPSHRSSVDVVPASLIDVVQVCKLL